MFDFFKARRRITWCKLGDIYCPAYGKLPAFSETGAVEHIDIVLAGAPKQDVQLLMLFLNVISFLPTRGLIVLVGIMDKADSFPELIAGWLRLLRLAIKGPIVSVYYGDLHRSTYHGVSVFQAIGYDIHCVADPGSQSVSDDFVSKLNASKK